MRPPEGYNLPEGKYCHLRKCIYGLKQAARVWNHLLTEFLEQLGFRKFHADYCVLSNGSVIIAIYVDDLLLFGQSLTEVKRMKAKIRRKFQVKDLGEASTCLEIRITRDRKNRRLWIYQSAYARSIDNLISSRGIDLYIAWIPGHRDIEGNEMADKAAKPAAQSRGMNAMPFKHKSLKTARVNLIKRTIKKEWKDDWKTAKGDARHLRRITNKLCQFNSNPTHTHFKAAKRHASLFSQIRLWN